MTNAEIAEAFTMIAKILDLRGENVFRVRAYERAALVIASLPREVADIYGEGGTKTLKEIGGIGDDLAQKIEEMVKTGKLRYLAELRKSIPPGLLLVMQVEGMGPKKTKMVWERLKVKTIEDLEKAAKAGKLAKLPRWGEQSEKKILQAIAAHRSLGTRIALPYALALAQGLAEQLRKSKLCEKLEIGGSLRRRKESIGDIDLLATSKQPAKVMELFTALPGVKRVINKGPTKSTVLLASGIQADLRVVESSVFGAALHYFTGNREHNIAIRMIGQKKGVTISEYGVHKGTAEKKGKLIAAETEEQVFKTVGLPFIPPELRENRGEIEAAKRGTLPLLVEEGNLQGDLHMHTTFSDGSADMVTMARAAQERGLTYIAITDHASGMGMVKGVKKANIAQYLRMIEQTRKKIPGIHILAGAEVDIQADGTLYLSDDVLKHLDWVVASIHSHMRQTSEEMTQRLLRAIENPFVRLIAHPTARLLLKRSGVEYSMETVFKAAAKHGVALELNASAHRLDLNDVHVKLAKDLGCKICIDSDAHDPRELDYRFGISQARRGWIERKDVINAMPWNTFERWLQSRKG